MKEAEDPMPIKFLTMDVKQMSFKNGQFDAIIDKAVLDAVACEPRKAEAVNQMV